MGGTLEILLVSAQGIRHMTNIIGKSAYYVVLECGNEVHRSKTSKGLLSGHDQEIFWNEKFSFDLPRSEMDNEIYLKLKIMDEEIFSHGEFVGETTIYLKGIIIEGKDKGSIEVKATPYNVVVDDDTFKGQIKVGLKYYTSDHGTQAPAPAAEKRENFVQADDDDDDKKEEKHQQNVPSICKSIVNFWHLSWRRFLFGCKSSKSNIKNKNY